MILATGEVILCTKHGEDDCITTHMLVAFKVPPANIMENNKVVGVNNTINLSVETLGWKGDLTGRKILISVNNL